MQEVQDICNPLFDFSEFYDKDYLTDCKLILKDPSGSPSQEIKAHVVVLANASNYFYDIFTSGMKEQYTGIVEIKLNAKHFPCFIKVLQWMYTGQLDCKEDELIPILSIADYYRVQLFEDQLKEHLSHYINKNNIMNFVDQCYDMNFVKELQYLEQYIVNLFDEIDKNRISESLDVKIFCEVIMAKDYDVEQRFKSICSFISNYEPTNEEKQELARIIQPIDSNIRNLIKTNDVKWLPDDMLSSIKNSA